ncbi:MAG: nitrous oxidase accessory protein [Euryarchaeota archaeon]|nr:nitrous oxidase accessory protein [Euryarchaeota archaeon]
MPPMNTAWPWSSQACATSGIEISGRDPSGMSLISRVALSLIVILLFLILALAPVEANVIQAGSDVQSAIYAASAGDTVVVVAGDVSSFKVDRPITIEGIGEPVLSAALQKPAIKVMSDGVTITGFRIRGVGKDSTAKFNYYMQNPAAAANAALDDPNSAIVVKGDGVSLKNCSIFGAQVAISAEAVRGLVLQNMSMDSCDTGASILQSRDVLISSCHMANCKKYGLDIERSFDVRLENNSIVNNTNGGALLKESEDCVISDNQFSQNTFGLSLWNASNNEVKRNRADHNYYGILITAGSNFNNITDNSADDNSRGEIVTGFGIGISLQENSSHNILINNRAKGNFNGLEVSKGCQFNAVYANTASDNKHGIRLNENRNNLVFGNNFIRNEINAYENTSLNIWNTTFGNYYSDYDGLDGNGDGIGDESYSLPGPESQSFDFRPLISPSGVAALDFAALKEEVKRYAVYAPAVAALPTTRVEDGVVVISRKASSSPPKWSDSDSFDASAVPFLKKTQL